MKFVNGLQFAKKMDREDPVRAFRNEFHIPSAKGKHLIYFTGNSLGLQPKRIKRFISEELADWATLGVDGHLNAKRPWLYYHKFSKKALGKIVGAKSHEVVAMSQLTVNLHLMLVSFYRPTQTRFKIMVESGAFSSDQYAIEAQLKWHGIDPKDALIELKPGPGETTLRTTAIVAAIHEAGSSLALVLFGGVQYYTGQFFDIKKITKAAQDAGAYAGFDLAHAVGNVPLSLHRHNVDFAVWCSYKYLNAGPGAIAGAFVHERHGKNFTLPRFAGWWGHDEQARFLMEKDFKPMEGIDGWQVSNVPIFQAAALLASLEVFQEASMSALRRKSILLTGYLEFLLNDFDPEGKYYTIITPKDPRERGNQLSLRMHQRGKKIFSKLTAAGVVTDWREPDVVRVAPVPLYNTFEEVYRFVEIITNALHA